MLSGTGLWRESQHAKLPRRVGRKTKSLPGAPTMGSLVSSISLSFPHSQRLVIVRVRVLMYRCLFLGYDRAAQPVQTIPRVVTKVARPVLSVSITVSPTVPCDEICLMSIRILQWPVFSTPKKLYAFGMTDTSKSSEYVLTPLNASLPMPFSFPAYSFPSEFVAYRPPQAASRNSASIEKVVSCEDTFAALSSSGELFTFHLQSPPEPGGNASKSRFNVQPQRVWALRKQFSAVRVG